jgi:hypothetical protein
MIKDRWLGEAWTPETGEMALQVYEVDEQGFVDRRLHLENHMQIAHAIWSMTPAEFFAQITVPTLLVVPIPPGMAEQPDAWQQDKQKQVAAALELLPQGEVAWFSESIHDIPWQRPQVLAERIITFIKGH